MRQTAIEQIDNALRNSFAAIKQDMFSIQSSVNEQAQDLRELKVNLEQFREGAVTTDKLNLVKIKIGEINEHLKRLWTIEDNLKNLENKFASRPFVSQQVDTVLIRLADLRNRIDAVAKSAVSEAQIRLLIQDVNRELNGVKAEITQVKADKSKLDPALLEKVAFKLNKKIEELRGELGSAKNEFAAVISDLRKSSKSFVTEKQVNGLIQDINVEFDKVKEVLKYNSDAIDALREDLKKSGKGPSINLDPVFNNIDGLRKDVAELRSNSAKEYEMKLVSKDIKNLSDQLHQVRNQARAPVSVEHKPAKTAPAKTSKKAGSAQAPAFDALVEQKKKKLPLRKTMFFGNLFIAFGIITIVVSLASYFFGLLDLSDRLAVGGVGVFIFGLLLRVIASLRKKNMELVE